MNSICNGSPLDSLTVSAGHEYAEAITDPFFSGWYGSGGFINDEIADKCDTTTPQTVELGDTVNTEFMVPALWSNERYAGPKGPNPCVFSS